MTAAETTDDELVDEMEEALMYGPMPATASALLDAAYAPELVADEDEWWREIWPLVKPIERSLRAGQNARPADARALWRIRPRPSPVGEEAERRVASE